MKKRTIALMLSVLAVMMLVGVGFATWVISQGSEASANGNIVVETVIDERLEVAADSAEHEIVFGAPESASAGWLTSDHKFGEATKTVKMDDTFTFTITKANGGTFNSENDVTVVPSFLNGSGTSANPALISNGTVTELSKELSTDSKQVIVKVKVVFGWGTLFGGANPYAFFNADGIKASTQLGELAATANAACLKKAGVDFTATDTYADLALSALTALQTFTSVDAFSIKVEFKVAAEA